MFLPIDSGKTGGGADDNVRDLLASVGTNLSICAPVRDRHDGAPMMPRPVPLPQGHAREAITPSACGAFPRIARSGGRGIPSVLCVEECPGTVFFTRFMARYADFRSWVLTRRPSINIRSVEAGAPLSLSTAVVPGSYLIPVRGLGDPSDGTSAVCVAPMLLCQHAGEQVARNHRRRIAFQMDRSVTSRACNVQHHRRRTHGAGRSLDHPHGQSTRTR